tara:strand:- start:26 stop:250 length:225 start_codon:yes stop_codon:yes gene_type:complete
MGVVSVATDAHHRDGTLMAKFTRMHYIRIASILASASDIPFAVRMMADMFEEDNDRFDRDKFLEAALKDKDRNL